MLVQPEGDPGHDDEHAARDVDGDEIVGELSLEDELHLETAVLSWKVCIINQTPPTSDPLSLCTSVGDDVAVGALVLLQGEPGQVEARHDLDGVHVLPLVDQVVSGPAVCNGAGSEAGVEWIFQDTHSSLFAEHTLVYLEGTTSGPSGMPGSARFYNNVTTILHF